MIGSANSLQIPWKSLATIFYRLVYEPPFFIVMVYHDPKGTTIFYMVVDFQGIVAKFWDHLKYSIVMAKSWPSSSHTYRGHVFCIVRMYRIILRRNFQGPGIHKIVRNFNQKTAIKTGLTTLTTLNWCFFGRVMFFKRQILGDPCYSLIPTVVFLLFWFEGWNTQSRWWFQIFFWECSPLPGETIQFDLRIFFKGVGKKTTNSFW